MVHGQPCAINMTGAPLHALLNSGCSMDSAGQRFDGWSGALYYSIMQGDKLGAEGKKNGQTLCCKRGRETRGMRGWRGRKSVGAVDNLRPRSNTRVFKI